MEYTIRIGGEAGLGISRIAVMLTKFLSRSGYHVFASSNYMSRIRGGHNFYQIQMADRQISALREKVDILLAFDTETVTRHLQDISPKGYILFDSTTVHLPLLTQQSFSVPFLEITEKLEADKMMVHSVALGAVLAILGFEHGPSGEIIDMILHPPTKGTITTHKTAVQAGIDYVITHRKKHTFLQRDTPEKNGFMLINGSQAIGLGALVSGCKFFSAYPVPAAIGIMAYLAEESDKHNIIVEQAEDDIGAINMCLGASFAGVRAMASSAGGGFALMSESLSLAGMTETPVVIAQMQRPGPGEGLSTRTEQSDLSCALHGGQGEFLRIVFAPGSPEQAFHLTNKAFHLAEKYQIPVCILYDQYLADSSWSYQNFSQQLYHEDFRLRQGQLQSVKDYQRYRVSDSGISPMAVPGQSRHLVYASGDEHDENGHMTEESSIRKSMVEKRLQKKLPLIKEEIAPPTFYGEQNSDILLIGFGSTFGVMRQVVDLLGKTDQIAMLHFHEVFPLPVLEKFDYLSCLQQRVHTLCVENNSTGQFSRYLQAETGFTCSNNINRFDGRPFTVDSLIGAIHEQLQI